MNHPSLDIAVESDADAALAERLVQSLGFAVNSVHVKMGKSQLDMKLTAYNKAAYFSPWLVLRDLDHDAKCASEFVGEKLPERAPFMCFRIAVREAESWILADRDNLSAYLGIQKNKIPADPDALDNPKLTLVNLARKSRNKQIREAMVPLVNSTASVGPSYVTRLIEFASQFWDPAIAAKQSQSLARCIACLNALQTRWLAS